MDPELGILKAGSGSGINHSGLVCSHFVKIKATFRAAPASVFFLPGHFVEGSKQIKMVPVPVSS